MNESEVFALITTILWAVLGVWAAWQHRRGYITIGYTPWDEVVAKDIIIIAFGPVSFFWFYMVDG